MTAFAAACSHAASLPPTRGTTATSTESTSRAKSLYRVLELRRTPSGQPGPLARSTPITTLTGRAGLRALTRVSLRGAAPPGQLPGQLHWCPDCNHLGALELTAHRIVTCPAVSVAAARTQLLDALTARAPAFRGQWDAAVQTDPYLALYTLLTPATYLSLAHDADPDSFTTAMLHHICAFLAVVIP